MSGSFDQNAKNIWINQTTPVLTMPIDEMRRRVQRSKSKARREHVIGIAALGIALAAACVELTLGQPVRGWMNVIQVFALVAWFVYSTPDGSRNSILSLGLTSKSAPCLGFYRRELLLRRDRYRQNFRIVAVTFILVVPFVVRKYFLQGALIFALLVAFSVISYLRMKREAPRIQAEIDDLNAFERQVR